MEIWTLFAWDNVCGNFAATSNFDYEVNLLFDCKSYDYSAKRMKAVRIATYEFEK